MTKNVCLFLSLFVLVMFLSPAIGSDTVKIGYIDFRRATKQSEAGKKALERLSEKFARQEQKLRKMGEEVKALEDVLINPAMMTSAQMDKKHREYRRKRRDLENYINDYQEERTRAQAEALAPIEGDIAKVVEKIAKEENFTLVFDPTLLVAIHAPNAIDLTDKVIQAYNQQQRTKKQSKK